MWNAASIFVPIGLFGALSVCPTFHNESIVAGRKVLMIVEFSAPNEWRLGGGHDRRLDAVPTVDLQSQLAPTFMFSVPQDLDRQAGPISYSSANLRGLVDGL